MNIDCKDYRVREGDKVHLTKWPTKVDPVYKSKEQYELLLEEHVAKLSAMQHLRCWKSTSPSSARCSIFITPPIATQSC